MQTHQCHRCVCIRLSVCVSPIVELDMKRSTSEVEVYTHTHGVHCHPKRSLERCHRRLWSDGQRRCRCDCTSPAPGALRRAAAAACAVDVAPPLLLVLPSLLVVILFPSSAHPLPACPCRGMPGSVRVGYARPGFKFARAWPTDGPFSTEASWYAR
jgi:hypothetical protein